MPVPRVISFWLLALYVLLASAAFSDQNGLVYTRQRPAQLHIRGHRNYQQQISLQAAIESESPELLPTAAFTSPSSKYTNTRTFIQDLTHRNSTKAAHGSGGLWTESSRPLSRQRENLKDGLIAGIESPDLAKADGDPEETPIEQEYKHAINAPDEEEHCPSGIHTLDCEECGGPGRPWGDNSHIFHCRGIETEGYRWKDCYCMDFTDECGPCTFDCDSDGSPNDRSALEEELQGLTNETEDLEETSIEQQHNDIDNSSHEEECPNGIDTLDCEDCGGPEQTWETSPNRFHCKGIEEENQKWKDCYCLNWENARGPCTFDCDLGNNSNNGSTSEEELLDSTNEIENLNEASIEHQNNGAANVPDGEDCPTGHDTLDCEDCGGLEQTRETRRNDYHCIGKAIDGKTATVSTGRMIVGLVDLALTERTTTFPLRTCRIYLSPSMNPSDHVDLADDPDDFNDGPTDGQGALEPAPESSATDVREEEDQRR
ncbi:hypothetical protein KCU65_g2881, partial [Aureobasidium melanogenum]